MSPATRRDELAAASKYQPILIATLTAFLLLTLIRSPYPHDQLLHHAPMVLVLPALFVAATRGWLGHRAMTCIVAFLVLHAIGARWVYTAVPYDEWSRAVFGTSPGEVLGLSRNHYDRFVHVAFGVLAVPPLTEAAQRYGGLSRAWSLAVAVLFVGAISAAYEVFEWGLTMTVAPDLADRYNGQQGDGWDAQKDMALALGGAVVSGIWLTVRATTRYGVRHGPG